MTLLQSYIRKLLKEKLSIIDQPEAKILIPEPPNRQGRIAELPAIQKYQSNPINPNALQDLLDMGMTKLFDSIIKDAGHSSHKIYIKKLKNEIKPIIKYHKKFFKALRPQALANEENIVFDADILKSAQSPAYPSGHTTQAFYVAHKLSEIFPDLSRNFYRIADMIATSRLERGVHFPSDNEVGKVLAMKLVDRI
jgi:hypothetical protein